MNALCNGFVSSAIFYQISKIHLFEGNQKPLEKYKVINELLKK